MVYNVNIVWKGQNASGDAVRFISWDDIINKYREKAMSVSVDIRQWIDELGWLMHYRVY